MSTALTSWEELSAEANRDRRRQKRVPLTFQVMVCGLDESGHFFAEQTKTADISEFGCRFSLRSKPLVGDVVAVRVAGSRSSRDPQDRALLFEVRWVEAQQGHWVIGAISLQPHNLWRMAFPPAVT
jgi:hypothetical protein